jgi:hypothetical protein
MTASKDYVTLREASLLLGRTPLTVRKYIEQGLIKDIEKVKGRRGPEYRIGMGEIRRLMPQKGRMGGVEDAGLSVEFSPHLLKSLGGGKETPEKLLQRFEGVNRLIGIMGEELARLQREKTLLEANLEAAGGQPFPPPPAAQIQPQPQHPFPSLAPRPPVSHAARPLPPRARAVPPPLRPDEDRLDKHLVSFPPDLARGIAGLRFGLGTMLGDIEKGRTVPVHQLLESLLLCRDQIVLGGREVLGLLFRWKVEDYLIDHSLLVSLFAVWMAEGMGYSNEFSAEFGLAGLLHDVGLLEIATETLMKSGPLNPVERRKVNQHPLYSARAVARLGSFSERVRGMILEHHERHNGKGYPFGLRGEEISPGGRIMGLADTLAALMADRPYRHAFPLRRVLDELRSGMGSAFPVDLVRGFFDLSGLYPVHSLCLLHDGRTVQIADLDAKQPWNPTVILLDGRGKGDSGPLSSTGSLIARGKWA